VKLTKFERDMLRIALLDSIEKLRNHWDGLPADLKDKQNIIDSYGSAIRFRNDLIAKLK
jgi:hypothetical protein